MYPFECGRNWLGGLPPPPLADLPAGDPSASPPAWRAWCWPWCSPAPSWTWYRPAPAADAAAMGPPRGMTTPPPATHRSSPPGSSGDGASEWDDADDDPTREMERKDRALAPAPAMDDSDVDDVDSEADGG